MKHEPDSTVQYDVGRGINERSSPEFLAKLNQSVMEYNDTLAADYTPPLPPIPLVSGPIPSQSVAKDKAD